METPSSDGKERARTRQKCCIRSASHPLSATNNGSFNRGKCAARELLEQQQQLRHRQEPHHSPGQQSLSSHWLVGEFFKRALHYSHMSPVFSQTKTKAAQAEAATHFTAAAESSGGAQDKKYARTAASAAEKRAAALTGASGTCDEAPIASCLTQVLNTASAPAAVIEKQQQQVKQGNGCAGKSSTVQWCQLHHGATGDPFSTVLRTAVGSVKSLPFRLSKQWNQLKRAYRMSGRINHSQRIHRAVEEKMSTALLHSPSALLSSADAAAAAVIASIISAISGRHFKGSQRSTCSSDVSSAPAFESSGNGSVLRPTPAAEAGRLFPLPEPQRSQQLHEVLHMRQVIPTPETRRRLLHHMQQNIDKARMDFIQSAPLLCLRQEQLLPVGSSFCVCCVQHDSSEVTRQYLTAGRLIGGGSEALVFAAVSKFLTYGLPSHQLSALSDFSANLKRPAAAHTLASNSGAGNAPATEAVASGGDIRTAATLQHSVSSAILSCRAQNVQGTEKDKWHLEENQDRSSKSGVADVPATKGALPYKVEREKDSIQTLRLQRGACWALKLFFCENALLQNHTLAEQEGAVVDWLQMSFWRLVPPHCADSSLIQQLGIVAPEWMGLIEGLPLVCAGDNRFALLNRLAAMPLMLGDLLSISASALHAADRLYIVMRLLQVVANIHALGILHNDIKIENLLLSPEGSIHVADLGTVTPFTGKPVFFQRTGTDVYLDPQTAQSFLTFDLLAEQQEQHRQQDEKTRLQNQQQQASDKRESEHRSTLCRSDMKRTVLGDIASAAQEIEAAAEAAAKAAVAPSSGKYDEDREESLERLRSMKMIYTPLRDAWATGIICYHIWCGGALPYNLVKAFSGLVKGRDVFQLIAELPKMGNKAKLIFPEGSYPEGQTTELQEVKHIIEGLLATDARQRRTPIEIILQSPLFSRYRDKEALPQSKEQHGDGAVAETTT